MQNSPATIKFIDAILDEKGMEGIEEEVRLQLRADLLQRLETKINQTIINSLPSGKLEQFEQLIDTNQINQLQPFLEESGVDVQAVVARCMSDFRANYLGV